MLLTKLGLVPARMVELLDFVVRVRAVVGAGALLFDVGALGVLVLVEIGPAVVFLGVIVVTEALLMGV